MGSAGVEADQIRQFIADAYANWGTRRVLLGGDNTVIPIGEPLRELGNDRRRRPAHRQVLRLPERALGHHGGALGVRRPMGPRGRHRSHARGYVGRAPVETATETANFVNKTIHERNHPQYQSRHVGLVERLLDGSHLRGGHEHRHHRAAICRRGGGGLGFRA